jgi:hypothetical protein
MPKEPVNKLHSCRICGCTSINCIKCIVRTGQPCSWIEINGMPTDLCTACAAPKEDGDKKDTRIPLSRLKVIAKQGNTETRRIIDELLVLRGAV